MRHTILIFIVAILSVHTNAKTLNKVELLEDFSFKHISIKFNDKTYCIEATETEFIPVNDVQGCQKITDISIMNKGTVCIEDEDVVCKKIKRKSSGVFWGSNNKIKFSQSLSELKSKFIKKDDGGNAGKKYYKKAKKYYKKKDYNNAYKWAKKSADSGYKGGYFGVGLAYELGKGVEVKNKKKALEWYLKAAELGHTQAQANAGRLLMFDNGSESEKWYTKAAEKGHLQSQNNLGYMYERGMGSSMWGDKKKAYKYYLMAAKQGSGVAQRNVCLYHWKGDGGAKKSSTIAKEWCQKAVDGGYSKAHALLERVSQD